MKSSPALAALVLSLAVSSSALADDAASPQDEVETPRPQVRYPPSSVRPKLIIGGLAISGLAYAAAFGTASNWPEVPGSDSLKIPIFGPWIALGHSGCA